MVVLKRGESVESLDRLLEDGRSSGLVGESVTRHTVALDLDGIHLTTECLDVNIDSSSRSRNRSYSIGEGEEEEEEEEEEGAGGFLSSGYIAKLLM